MNAKSQCLVLHPLNFNSLCHWERFKIASDSFKALQLVFKRPRREIISTKVGFISVTQAVDLDTIESDTATKMPKLEENAEEEEIESDSPTLLWFIIKFTK